MLMFATFFFVDSSLFKRKERFKLRHPSIELLGVFVDLERQKTKFNTYIYIYVYMFLCSITRTFLFKKYVLLSFQISHMIEFRQKPSHSYSSTIYLPRKIPQIMKSKPHCNAKLLRPFSQM